MSASNKEKEIKATTTISVMLDSPEMVITKQKEDEVKSELEIYIKNFAQCDYKVNDIVWQQ